MPSKRGHNSKKQPMSSSPSSFSSLLVLPIFFSNLSRGHALRSTCSEQPNNYLPSLSGSAYALYGSDCPVLTTDLPARRIDK